MRGLKIFLVIVGALGVTALGIDAADTFTGTQTTLLASLIGTKEVSLCPEGMVPMHTDTATICVDRYEAGVGVACPFPDPRSIEDTLANVQAGDCKPVSASGVLPWRFVPYRVAEQLCARAGKSLPTPDIWYKAALGTPDSDEACRIDEGSVSKTGEAAGCVSGIEAFDMIGNVWELVQGEVVDGNLKDQKLPEAGYVTAVNDNGIPSETAVVPTALYGDDYFWREASGTYAVMRGGFYRGQNDAGLYSVQAGIAQDFAGEAIGFRCVKTL